MKLLQIPNYMYPNIGGIEQIARDIADSLLDRENMIQKIICFNEDASDGEYITHRGETVHDKVDGIDVVRCGCVTKVASQSLSPSYPRELHRLLSDFDPDVVIFHYPNPFVASFLLPMLKDKVKLILYWHLDITKQKRLGKLFHGQTLKLCRRAEKIVATSPNYIEGSPYLSRFREKCTVIPNCISAKRLEVTPEIRRRAENIRRRAGEGTIVFAVGRHVEYKGMKYLIRASRYISDDITVLIGGKGPLTHELFKEKEGNSRVHMLGRISDETLIACMLACDIFAFPSITKNEAFGIALAEGMYFGKPAVTFNIPGSGVNYVSLGGVTGIECPNCDSRAYGEALQRLADDAELRKKLGANAKQRVEELFLYRGFSRHINELISGVMT